MLQVIISYLTQVLQQVFPAVEIKGLAVLVTNADGENIITEPATYCANGELQPIDTDFYNGLIYIRQTGKVTERTLSDEESPDYNIYKERRYSLRIVAFVPKDIYKTDNAYINEKLAENITKAISSRNKSILLNALNGASDIEITVTEIDTDAESIWMQEYNNVAFSVPFTTAALALGVDVTVEAALKCFEYWGCHDETTAIIVPPQGCPECEECEDCEDCEECPECPPGEFNLLYEDTTLFKTITGNTTINDNIIYESDGVTVHGTIKPEQNFTLPECDDCEDPGECEDVNISNSDDTFNVNLPAGSTMELTDINIRNFDESFSISYPAKKNYLIPNTELLNTAAESLGVFPSVTAIIAPDVTLKDTVDEIIGYAAAGADYILLDGVVTDSIGTPLDTKPYGQTLEVTDSVLTNSNGSFTYSLLATENYIIADSVAKNSANTTVDTKPHGQNLIIADSTVFKSNGSTVLASVVAEGTTTITTLMNLLTASELHADLTTISKLNAIIALLTNSNLGNLTSGQLDYITTILTNSNLANLTTAQKNHIVTLLVSAQVQLLSNTQLGYLSSGQVAYILANSPPTTYNFPLNDFSSTSYANGDSAWVQANIFNNLPIGITPRLTDYYNLKTHNNAFGNLKRFTGVTGGYEDDAGGVWRNAAGAVTTEALAFPDNYLIDHYTGLGHIRTSFAVQTWANAIAVYSTYSTTVNGILYNDFFVLDMPKFTLIRNLNTSYGIPAPFVFTNAATWTSSTLTTASTAAIIVTSNGRFDTSPKSGTARYLLARKHY